MSKGLPNAKDENLRNGLDGTFSYFRLGRELEKQAILDGKDLPSYEALAGYVFWTATGEEFHPKKMKLKEWFIGESREYDVFLLYDEKLETLKNMALTLDIGRRLPSVSGKPKLVFAPSKYLDPGLSRTIQNHFLSTPVRDLPSCGAQIMQLKNYQSQTLDAVKIYLTALGEMREKDRKARAIDQELGIDWASKGWEKVSKRVYHARRNGLGVPLPSFCLKIPTGGGKTLLATKTIDLINTLPPEQPRTGALGRADYPNLQSNARRAEGS